MVGSALNLEYKYKSIEMCLHSQRILASRGGKRAQKKPNNPKSWGAEQKDPIRMVDDLWQIVPRDFDNFELLYFKSFAPLGTFQGVYPTAAPNQSERDVIMNPIVFSTRGNSRGHFWRKNLQDFFYTKKSLFPSKSIQNRIIFGSPIRKSYIDWEMMTFPGSLYWLTPWKSSAHRSSMRPHFRIKIKDCLVKFLRAAETHF